MLILCLFFFFQAEDGIRDLTVTGVQTCALPISPAPEWRQCGTVPAASVGEPRRRNLELDRAFARRKRLRLWPCIACGSQDSGAERLAPGAHEHRASCAGSTIGCFPGLAKASRAVTSHLAKFAVLTTRS